MAKNIADETVLFVDDEKRILDALRRELINEEYRCLFALSGSQALRFIQKENISVIVCDLKMPEMDGLRLLKLVKEQYPTIVRTVLSGYAQLPQILVTINQAEIFKFITKPWGIELKSVIMEAIIYHQLLEDRNKIGRMLSIQTDNSISMTAAKSSSALFAAMGVEAFKVAAQALESSEKRTKVKKQLLMASSLLQALSEMDFEDYANITLQNLYEKLKQQIHKGNIKEVEIDKGFYPTTVCTRHKVLIGFVSLIIQNLTDFPHDYYIQINPKIIESSHLRKHEVAVHISPLEGWDVPDNGYLDQQIYVDMLNQFASKAFSLLGGEFLGVIAKGVITLKVVVHDCGQQNQNADLTAIVK